MIPVCDPLFNNLFDKKYFPDTIALQIAVAGSLCTCLDEQERNLQLDWFTVRGIKICSGFYGDRAVQAVDRSQLEPSGFE